MKIQSNSDKKYKFDYEIHNYSMHARFYREICKFKVSYFEEENDNDSVNEYDYEYSDDKESDNEEEKTE